MILALGVLLIALAPPVLSLGAAQAAQAASSAKAPSMSFEQISEAAIRAWNESRDEDAIRLFQQGLKIKPDWNEGLWYLGAIFYDHDQYREARDLLRHYVAQNPDQGPAWAMLGLSDYKLHEYARALDHLRRSISLGFEGREQLQIAAYYHEAILSIRFGQCESGLRTIYALRGRATPLAQAPMEVPAGLSAFCYQLLPEEVPPERAELVTKMGNAILARMDGHPKDALDILRDLASKYPNEKSVRYQYGAALLGEHSPSGVEEMQKVLEIAPSSTEARMELAAYYQSQSQADKALAYVDEVLKIDASHLSAHVLKGEILLGSGDAAAAVRELEQARQLAPEENRVRWALMRAYAAAGRRDDAARVKAEIEKAGAKASHE